MNVDPSAPVGALCTLHPDRSAAQVCSRCGNFMCDECAAGGTLCPTCRNLVGPRDFPFSREAHDFNSLWNTVYLAWKRDPVIVSVAAFIVAAVGSIGSFASQFAMQMGTVFIKDNLPLAIGIIGGGVGAGLLISMVLQGIVQMGMVRMSIDVLQGGTADLGRLFSQMKRLGPFIAQWLIVFAVAFGLFAVIGGAVGVAVFALGVGRDASFDANPAAVTALLAGMAVLIPGFFALGVWASPVLFAPMELVYGGCSGVDSLKRAFIIGSGHRWEIVGYTLVGSALTLASFVVGVLMLCIGLIATVPAAQSLYFMLMTSKYLALRNGCPGLPPPEVEG